MKNLVLVPLPESGVRGAEKADDDAEDEGVAVVVVGGPTKFKFKRAGSCAADAVNE